MLDRHSGASGMLPPSVEPGQLRRRMQPMRIARLSAWTACLFLICLAAALSVHVHGASLPKGGAAEDPMIPKIEAIFAPLSDATTPGVAVLVRRGAPGR